MKILRPARVALLTLAAVLLVSLMLGRSDQPAGASHETPGADGAGTCGPLDGSADDTLPTSEPCVVDFVRIDVVDLTNNAGDDLGAFDDCVEVASSASFDVDIVVDALPDITPAGANNAGDGVNNFNDGATLIQVIVEYDNDLLTLGTIKQYLEEIIANFGTPSILGVDPDSTVGIAGIVTVTELDAGTGAANRVVIIPLGPDTGDAGSPVGKAAEEGIRGVFVRLPFTAAAGTGVAEVSVLGSFGANSTKVIQVDNGLFTIDNLYGADGGTGPGLSADDEAATSFVSIDTACPPPGVQAIQDVIDELQKIVDDECDTVTTACTPLGSKVRDALLKLKQALTKLTDGDNLGAMGEIVGTVGDLEAAVKDNGLGSQGTLLMDNLAGAALQLAENAIADAIASVPTGVTPLPSEITDAQQFVIVGDGLRAIPEFKNAVAKYNAAKAKAESYVP